VGEEETPPTLATFYVDATDARKPALFVDGVDLIERYRIKRVALEMSAGNIPHLQIELVVGHGAIEGIGIVTQYVPIEAEPMDQRESMLAFLDNVDPETLSAAALARGGMLAGDGGAETMGESFVAVMKEMLHVNHGT
jgi:hypothetical protein